MPYFYWTGVALTGNQKKGTLFARSPEHLDELLFKRQIALMRSKPVRQWIKKPIRLSHLVQFFRQLAVLVDAGVLLPSALTIVGDQISHPPLQEVIHDIAGHVKEGISLSALMERYPAIFNHVMVQLVKAGEESGHLSESLEGICTHVTTLQDFYSRVRSALMMPIITLGFFLVIACVICLIVMPRFVDIFTSLRQEVPPFMKTMLAITAFITSWSMLALSLGLALIGIVLWRLKKQGYAKGAFDRIVLRIPIIGTLLQERFLAYTFQTAALLIQSGMPVMQALTTVRESLRNSEQARYIGLIELDVAAGCSLSDAMTRYMGTLFSPDVIAMVEIGQESGRLGLLLSKVALSYHDRITRKLSFMTMILQPLIMIILGLLVAALIFAVYGPIFSMSSSF